jgi:hypothetical protein
VRALILAHSLDPTASALALALRRQGTFAVECATIDRLAAARWQHAIAARGMVETAVDLGDGTSDAAPDVVFNRLHTATTQHFKGWNVTDRQYGQTELLALLLSWLTSLGERVVNKPVGGSLAGPLDKPWLWLARAKAVGLPLHPAGATTSTRRFAPPRDALERHELLPAATPFGLNRTAGYSRPAATFIDLLVVGDRIIGADAASAAHERCLRLARLAQTAVLAVRLSRSFQDSTWQFVAANPAPVIDGGEPLAALMALLTQRAGGAR